MEFKIQKVKKEEKITTGIYLTKALHAEVVAIAEESGVSVNEAINQLLSFAVCKTKNME